MSLRGGAGRWKNRVFLICLALSGWVALGRASSAYLPDPENSRHLLKTWLGPYRVDLIHTPRQLEPGIPARFFLCALKPDETPFPGVMRLNLTILEHHQQAVSDRFLVTRSTRSGCLEAEHTFYTDCFCLLRVEFRNVTGERVFMQTPSFAVAARRGWAFYAQVVLILLGFLGVMAGALWLAQRARRNRRQVPDQSPSPMS